jgi:hypothetical protein
MKKESKTGSSENTIRIRSYHVSSQDLLITYAGKLAMHAGLCGTTAGCRRSSVRVRSRNAGTASIKGVLKLASAWHVVWMRMMSA